MNCPYQGAALVVAAITGSATGVKAEAFTGKRR